MANKRSDISKLVSSARKVWRETETYKEVKKAAKIPGKTGWFLCRLCKREAEVIRIDHISPVGKQPLSLREFGAYYERLFCGKENLQPLCSLCHKAKTKEEGKVRRAELRELRKGDKEQ